VQFCATRYALPHSRGGPAVTSPYYQHLLPAVPLPPACSLPAVYPATVTLSCSVLDYLQVVLPRHHPPCCLPAGGSTATVTVDYLPPGLPHLPFYGTACWDYCLDALQDCRRIPACHAACHCLVPTSCYLPFILYRHLGCSTGTLGGIRPASGVPIGLHSCLLPRSYHFLCSVTSCWEVRLLGLSCSLHSTTCLPATWEWVLSPATYLCT